MRKYPLIECIKNWELKTSEYTCKFIAGKKYKVRDVKPNFYNSNGYVTIGAPSDAGGTWFGNFWSGSDYFNVDEYISQLKGEEENEEKN